ncbi:S24/S26 family peptidase [Prevotella sp.]|uniref:S24/S26 family peptidase n=1 Tax=Prevotella sp. TaxID=59823 RepID=UPI0025F74F78|nr:S24/S26 family peptidase [Prevotella sp.]
MTPTNNNQQLKHKEFANDVIIPEIARLLDEGHSVTLTLRGVSMRPFLEDGRDKAILTKPSKPVRVGDVVLAEVSSRRYALHRIVKIEGSLVTMRGDGNLATEQFDASKVLGIARCFYRKGRKRPDYTTGWKWRIYSAVWTALLPVRRYLLFAYRITLKLKQ